MPESALPYVGSRGRYPELTNQNFPAAMGEMEAIAAALGITKSPTQLVHPGRKCLMAPLGVLVAAVSVQQEQEWEKASARMELEGSNKDKSGEITRALRGRGHTRISWKSQRIL